MALVALAGCGGDGGTPERTRPACPVVGKQVSLRLLAPGKRYVATVRTNLGSFAFALDQADSPCTAASFVSLVRSRFFDGTSFHRIVPGFVVQGGDPTGTGRGGPGYTVRDDPPPTVRYTLGTVAMAKTQGEPSGTSGSQFFVVTAEDASLQPEYALLGKVTRGFRVVARIGRLGDSQNGRPTRRVVMQRVTVVP